MSSSKISDDTDTNFSSTATSDSPALPTQVVFYVFLLLDIPSIACSLLLFMYFMSARDPRHQHHSNPTITYLLVGSFLVTTVDLPLILPYLQNHYFIASMKNPNPFCVFWIMYDYGMYSLNLWLMALACLERYLLIFFKQIVVRNRKRRFVLYYLSVTIIALFVLLWYTYLVALYPCEQTQFDLTQIVCGFPCYKIVGSPAIINMDWSLADLLPVFLTILFIVMLILHVLYQRRKISKHLIQRETWKRTRKMFLQLLPIALIFLVFNMPLIIVGLLAISYPWFNTVPYFYANSLSYCLPMCMPFAVLSAQKTMRMQLFAWLRRRKLNQLAPATLNTRPLP